MPRYYVKKDEKWNVFSSIVDDFLYSDFMSFEELKAVVIGEVVVEKLRDLETLLTNRPKLNTMPFSEAMEIINCKDEVQTIRCPKCGRSDYIREFGKDFSVTAEEAGFKYKCINCNTYIELQTDCP